MNTTHQCPKCGSRKLWLVEKIGARDLGDPVVNNSHPLRIANRSTPPTKEKTFWSGDGAEYYDAGWIDALICAQCGFTELWSRELQGLVHNPASGVHFIDSSA